MNLVRKHNSPFFPALFDEWLSNEWLPSSTLPTKQLPAVNIQETDTSFLLELAAPGVKKEDLQVEVEKDILSISSQSDAAAEEDAQYTRKEYGYLSFRRTFTIPESVDIKKIEAQYREGILEVKLPKKKEMLQDAKKSIRIR
ncbi:MAG: 18 kDa heat shock protein [Flavobacteriaceae bacterium]|mgnify:FL=1|nr:MAG: 18 kDa heat shock protein [Flavobacteriaceae bacterium]|tara:strand:+ start:17205 stop:17630 length:426 start_codon:yes stop_codon:yes gene_type:complete